MAGLTIASILVQSVYDLIDSLRRHFRREFAALRRVDTARILRALWCDSFQLKPPLQARIDQFIALQFRRPTLGVGHVRYSDHAPQQPSRELPSSPRLFDPGHL